MRVRSPIPKKHARIEIIPLIDIMFFLLASFMMVSLSQTHMKGIRVNLPSPFTPPPTAEPPKDVIRIKVTEGHLTYFDNVLVNDDEVLPRLFELYKQNHDVKVSLSAEQQALHGDVMIVLDRIRQARIDKVGYQIKPATAPGTPGG